MSYIVGIDLGTTNSVVSIYEAGKVEVITNSEGEKTTPSVVFFNGNSEVVVGSIAKRQHVTNPTLTIRSAKRLIGRRFEEIENRNQYTYQLVPDENNNVLIDLGWTKLTPEEVSAEILKKMKATAEDFLNDEITQAVITVPAYFNDSQRGMTKKAAELAGLEVMRMINEPTAAALAYGLHKSKEEHIAVFDFGGGTFDISVLELNDDIYEVKSTNGDTQLGGDNIDEILYSFLRDLIIKDCQIDIENDLQAMQRVKEAAEKAKCELSTMKSTMVSLPFIGYTESGPKNFSYNIKREEFEQLIEPIFERLINPCRQALTDARLSIEQINTVLLVGGSTRIPVIQKLVRDFFQKEPSKEVNPDEAVSIGAAIQASVITGALQEVLLLDITPLSLGIELAGGLFSPIIPRNSSIPTTATKKFTTVVDNQDTVFIHVLQGERKIASENRSLSHFRLKGIPLMPREIPEIEVRFHMDANGILNVSARDCTSGLSKEIVVESYQQLPLKEAEKVVAEAEKKSKDDIEIINKLRIINNAKIVIQSVIDFMEDEADRIDEQNTKILKEALIKLEIAIHNNNINAIPGLQSNLTEAADFYGDFYLPYKTGEKRAAKAKSKANEFVGLVAKSDEKKEEEIKPQKPEKKEDKQPQKETKTVEQKIEEKIKKTPEETAKQPQIIEPVKVNESTSLEEPIVIETMRGDPIPLDDIATKIPEDKDLPEKKEDNILIIDEEINQIIDEEDNKKQNNNEPENK